MLTRAAVVLSFLFTLKTLTLTSAEPFSFPLENGFPFPSDAALEELFTRAGGNFTNAPLAPRFDDDSLTSWKLQAFNEFMEVAFFTQLIANITKKVPGYELESSSRDYILDTLKVIQAQEEMHAYNANDAVRYFTNGSHIFPCTYDFPVSSFAEAVSFAQTFTDMYIGLLANIQQRTAKSLGSDSNSIIYVLAQALGQEGQQSGWFRSLQRKPPSAEPFLTSSTREFVFSWLQRFIVPGSCPNMVNIPLRVIPRLELVSVVDRKEDDNKVVKLVAPGVVDPKSQRVAFVNGALVPTVVPFRVVEKKAASSCRKNKTPGLMEQMPGLDLGLQGYGGNTDQRSFSAEEGGGTRSCIESTEVEAVLPYAHNVMHGMILAAIVEKGATFITAEDVTGQTLYGPAVIELS
ncbi:hypothetical protein QBC37DRAFT_284137 [Rhypophila decipiens]|uniref:Late sexual development protein n=1 Tax=Rhypophila decipiens TaxID=261697 RepID=A0AAN7B6A7_9PEZI|nr:hypothetical protein QBC37DRAFT_284137 [Rhypophila decipiens]